MVRLVQVGLGIFFETIQCRTLLIAVEFVALHEHGKVHLMRVEFRAVDAGKLAFAADRDAAAAAHAGAVDHHRIETDNGGNRLLTRHFEQAMEESCDDLAAALVASDTDYLHGVMQVARSDHGPPAYALPNLATHPLLERFRRFRQFRERETDFRGLYWSSLLLAASITLLWTVEVVERPAGAAPLRIIGVVAPAEAETFDVKLAPRERAPPRLDPALR